VQTVSGTGPAARDNPCSLGEEACRSRRSQHRGERDDLAQEHYRGHSEGGGVCQGEGECGGLIHRFWPMERWTSCAVVAVRTIGGSGSLSSGSISMTRYVPREFMSSPKPFLTAKYKWTAPRPVQKERRHTGCPSSKEVGHQPVHDQSLVIEKNAPTRSSPHRGARNLMFR
jgi:hypothetical protein